MNAWIKWIGVGLLALVCHTAGAQESAPQLDASQLAVTLSGLIKDRLAKALPAELVLQKEFDWGHTAQVPSIQGLTPIYVTRNHGNWQKARVVVHDVPTRLHVNVGWLSSTAENRMSFTVHVTLPARLELQQQIWQNGVQVFTEQIHSRLQLSAHLQMEAEMEPAKAGAAPETAVRLRLVSGNYACENFVAENVGGLGGELARWLDSGSGRSFKAWQPAILNDLQKQIASGIANPAKGEEMSVCLAKLLLQTNAARADAAQSQGTVFVPTLSPVPDAPAPVCVHGSIGVGIDITNVNTVARVATPHIERMVHPALTNTAIHVTHAVLVTATHIALGAVHKK
jgi:hypothetical protein